VVVLASDRIDDREEAKAQARCGEQVRQQEESAGRPGPLVPPAATTTSAAFQYLLSRGSHAIPSKRASTLLPPFTRSPRRTLGSARGGSNTSVREPKRMYP
jgi:hypothetical protein